jgi:Protein of unknown function (DUF2771)
VGLSTITTVRGFAAGALALTLLTGCGGDDEPAAPEQVRVAAGNQTAEVKPTQYCLDGDGRRYEVRPPVVEVPADTPIRLTVPDSVARQGWSVQVFDQTLEDKIGEVAVDAGTAEFDGINSSDVVPATFYLVIVEDKGGPCGLFSGAWPVGFVRPGGQMSTATPTPAPAG